MGVLIGTMGGLASVTVVTFLKIMQECGKSGSTCIG
jgi:hypothetical protein